MRLYDVSAADCALRGMAEESIKVLYELVDQAEAVDRAHVADAALRAVLEIRGAIGAAY